MLKREIQQKIVDLLMRIPFTSTYDGREVLLEGIPQNIVNGLNRNQQREIDLYQIIQQLYNLGHLEDTGVRPLIIFLENALRRVGGTKVGTDLKNSIYEIEKLDQIDGVALSEDQEALIFGGSEERLTYDFFRGAIEISRSIARLKVPRYFGNRCDQRLCGYGTGWLVAPTFLLTNHHVIEARDFSKGEQRATEMEFHLQAQKTQVWFDYLYEGSRSYTECSCQELVYKDEALDYALLRLDQTAPGGGRFPLQLAHPYELYPEDRLNIVQYAGGGPLKFAVRNNFFVQQDVSDAYIHYLTDTEQGSSGAPVCNDDWQVVAMHCKTRGVYPETRKGETIRLHNIGVEIHRVVNDLRADLRQEILKAQKRS